MRLFKVLKELMSWMKIALMPLDFLRVLFDITKKIWVLRVIDLCPISWELNWRKKVTQSLNIPPKVDNSLQINVYFYFRSISQEREVVANEGHWSRRHTVYLSRGHSSLRVDLPKSLASHSWLQPQNDKIIESLRLQGTPEGHLIQIFCNEQGQDQVAQSLIQPCLGTTRDRAPYILHQ